MMYQLLNPYDPASLDAPNNAIALAAAVVMGGVKFSVRCQVTGHTCPNGDLDVWFVRETGLTIRAFLEIHRLAVATALESVRLQGVRSCRVVDVAGRARFFARDLRSSETSSALQADGRSFDEDRTM